MADTPRQDLDRAGIVPRVMLSWVRPAKVVRGLSGMSEGAMLAVLMGAMVVTLIAQMPGHSRAAHLDPSIPFAGRMAGAMIAVLFIMPLIAYGVAALVAGLSRLTPWRLEGADSRLALFWALLAVSPAMLLSGLVGGFVAPGPAHSLTHAVAGAGFVLIWGAGIYALAVRR
ncbi:MAG: hypothetical protein Q4F71_09395 [Paracoccus sp. (in: a-proteobacteria)]|nr:hypothetical protein [Paracoccus sp. (in: a-proteobacteria)]